MVDEEELLGGLFCAKAQGRVRLNSENPECRVARNQGGKARKGRWDPGPREQSHLYAILKALETLAGPRSGGTSSFLHFKISLVGTRQEIGGTAASQAAVAVDPGGQI